MKLTVWLLEALLFISYSCMIFLVLFFWLTHLFSHLSHLFPVPAVHSSSPLLVHNQCFSLPVLFCSFFLTVGSFSLLLFTRCVILLSSYCSLSASLLSPLLASHLWVIVDSCLTGRLMQCSYRIFLLKVTCYIPCLQHTPPQPQGSCHIYCSGFFVLLEPSLCAIVFSWLAALFCFVLMLVVPVHDRDRRSSLLLVTYYV